MGNVEIVEGRVRGLRAWRHRGCARRHGSGDRMAPGRGQPVHAERGAVDRPRRRAQSTVHEDRHGLGRFQGPPEDLPRRGRHGRRGGSANGDLQGHGQGCGRRDPGLPHLARARRPRRQLPAVRRHGQNAGRDGRQRRRRESQLESQVRRVSDATSAYGRRSRETRDGTTQDRDDRRRVGRVLQDAHRRHPGHAGAARQRVRADVADRDEAAPHGEPSSRG